ncbi:MAG: beta-hydroxyacyl-ACP dehydratase [Candidatus Omnitrophica bacterium]|nr:beta-hydroxyacyl-ACP dehydratase [Candidatus Omnitrophota bacterium]
MNVLGNNALDLRKTKILLVTDSFLFVDRVTYFDPGKKVIAEKDVTGEEWFFKGHFPGNPILPGHILAEAMIQAGTIILLPEHFLTKTMIQTDTFLRDLADRAKTVNYLTATKIRFFKITRPGKTIIMTGTPIKVISSAAIMHVEAHVDGELIARGDFTVARTKNK